MRTLTPSHALGILCLLWTAHNAILTYDLPSNARLIVASWTVLWLCTGALFLEGRRPRLAGGLLAGLATTELVAMEQWPQYGLILLAWGGLIIFAVPDTFERTFCLRTLVSSVYVFGGLSKLQPSWLRGENLFYLARSRPQSSWIELLPEPVIWLLAIGSALIEVSIGFLLWSARFRTVAAAGGLVLHSSLVYLATLNGVLGAIHLLVLNFGLVLMYPAFWTPITDRAGPSVPVLGTPSDPNDAGVEP